MHRRHFLKSALLLSGLALLPLGGNAWGIQGDPANGRRLIVIFLRGAVDGLNLLVPHQDPAYYDARPRIAIGRPGQEDGALDLDGQFGLHPALTSLMPFWQEKSLAFIPASGSPDPSRSHFDAQAFMESGVPGDKHVSDGWLNRLLAQLPGQRSPTEALSLGATMPLILQGRMPVANLALGRAATAPMAVDQGRIADAFIKLYRGSDPLSRNVREGRSARESLLTYLKAETAMADNGAPSPVGFPQDAARLGQLMNHDARLRIAFMALGGWDTHVNQGAGKGQLANNLRLLGRGLTALAQNLGRNYADTVIVLMSEFGRTVKENGNAGTDHGHGNVMAFLGGPVRGGRIWGKWTGLAPEALHENRDVPVNTDFRAPLAVLLNQHLNLDQAAVERTFPHYIPTSALEGLFT